MLDAQSSTLTYLSLAPGIALGVPSFANLARFIESGSNFAFIAVSVLDVVPSSYVTLRQPEPNCDLDIETGNTKFERHDVAASLPLLQSYKVPVSLHAPNQITPLSFDDGTAHRGVVGSG